MRKLVSLAVTLVAGFGLQAQPSMQFVFRGTYGPQNVFIGYDSWIQINFGWYNALPFTVLPDGVTISAPGHTFTENTYLVPSSTGTLPAALSSRRDYFVCGLSGGMFKLVASGNSCQPSSWIRFTDPGSGTHFLGLRAQNPVNVTLQLSGVPDGVTVEPWCLTQKCVILTNSLPTSTWGAQPFDLRISVAPTAQPVSAVIRATLATATGPLRTVDIPINLRYVQATPTKLKLPFNPPIPNKAKWESTMTTLAAKWCNVSNPVEVMSFGFEGQVWYYDGAFVYYQTADYTGNSAWLGCANNIVRQYRDFVLAQGGRVPAWRLFVAGLERAARMAGPADTSYITAITQLALNSPYAAAGGLIRDDGIRETAYLLEAQLAMSRLTGQRAPMEQRTADRLIGMFDSLFVSNNYVYQQLFMDGLALRALIDYYSMRQDARVPGLVKVALDWIYANAWVPGQGLLTNPEPLGPRCDWGCQSPVMDLVNLVAPAYAWYWALTGNPAYLSWGDELFSQSLNSDISYSGKIFSQNYRWSFDYVRWRTSGTLTRQ